MRVLLDTNVIVDVLQNREPWCRVGEQLFRRLARHVFTGCMTAKEATDIHYLTKRIFHGQEHSDRIARDILGNLFAVLELLDTCASDCKDAIASNCPDYEDAVMIQTALRSGLDGIVTRNTRDYRDSPVPVFSPSEFLEKLKEQEGGDFT